MLNKAFCLTCREYVKPEVTEVDLTYNYKDARVKYKELVGHCAKCQNEVYSPVINDANYDRRLEARRKCLDISKGGKE